MNYFVLYHFITEFYNYNYINITCYMYSSAHIQSLVNHTSDNWCYSYATTTMACASQYMYRM